MSKKLEKLYQIPVYHSDEIFGINWTKTPEKSIQKKSEEVFNLEKWIIDGNFAEQRKKMLKYAQIIIILNLPYHILFLRHIKRTLSAYTRFKLSSTKYFHKIHYKSFKDLFYQELIIGFKLIYDFKNSFYDKLISLGKQNNQSRKYVIIQNPRVIFTKN